MPAEYNFFLSSEMGSGTATSHWNYCVPHNTYYEDNRSQTSFTKAEIQGMGIRKGDKLVGIGYYSVVAPGEDVKNWRTYVGNTTTHPYTVWATYASMTSVVGPSNYAASSWLVDTYGYWTLSSPFLYTGNGLVVDFSRDNPSYTAGGTARVVQGLGTDRTFAWRDDGQTWPHTTTVTNYLTESLDLIFVFQRDQSGPNLEISF